MGAEPVSADSGAIFGTLLRVLYLLGTELVPALGRTVLGAGLGVLVVPAHAVAAVRGAVAVSVGISVGITVAAANAHGQRAVEHR